jgi:hypothetical protein
MVDRGEVDFCSVFELLIVKLFVVVYCNFREGSKAAYFLRLDPLCEVLDDYQGMF